MFAPIRMKNSRDRLGDLDPDLFRRTWDHFPAKLAEELKGRVAVNALWPQTWIATAAIWNRGQNLIKQCRKPEIMADAAHAILMKGSDVTGKFFIDEHVLREEGLKDFNSYACVPGATLRRDLYLEA